MFPNIPSLLSTLPELEVLKILCCCEDVREVVLKHSRISDLVVGNCMATMDHGTYVMERDIIVVIKRQLYTSFTCYLEIYS